MQFLKTLFWVLVAVVIALFLRANWTPITLNLWNDIQADTKLPVVLVIAFALGWIPTWLILRTRIWSLRRRIEAMERNRAAALSPEPAVADEQEPAV